MQRRAAWYIESVSRFDGPSLTGRIVAKVPGIKTFTQHRAWEDGKWTHQFSVLQDYTAATSKTPAPTGPLKIFVTLGTIQPYRFDRLVDRLLAVVPGDNEFVWQIGETVREDLPGQVHRTIAAHEMQREVLESDVVISHSGVGSAMQIMDLGKCPVLVPRRSQYGEHVDDHQAQIARELTVRSLAVTAEADELTLDHLLLSTRSSISRTVLKT
nr:glycosyltransferase [Williamsia sp. 1135]